MKTTGFQAHMTSKALFRYTAPVLSAAAIACISPSILAAGAETSSSAAVVSQKQFDSPTDAAKALVDAVRAGDSNAIVALFGPGGEDLAHSGDEVQDRNRIEQLATHVSELTAVKKKGDDSAEILIGKERWPLPIPLSKTGDKWVFDTEAGREEILNRRIGANELATIGVCKAIVTAQKEYFDKDPDGDGTKEYAAKLLSDEGKKNGLYWHTEASEDPSPMGEFVAGAQAQGYTGKTNDSGKRPYHGYIYRILEKQGAKAKGGAKGFVKNGHMTEGFALVAYPAEYGDSGVMTFAVNQDGVVMQKDLGEKTESIVQKVKEYNPDASWQAAR